MEFISNSPEDTKRFAKDFLAWLSAKSGDRATVVGLYGNLGSGKTTFTQYVAGILEVEEHLTSPTFVIMKRFKIKPARTERSPFGTGGDLRFKNLIHADCYRLKNSDELRRLGFEELLREPKSLILIEWAEHVADILPLDHLKLSFEFIDDKTRKISFYSPWHSPI